MSESRELVSYEGSNELVEVDDNQELVKINQKQPISKIQIINEIQTHLEFRNFTDKIEQFFKIDYNSYLLRSLKRLQQDEQHKKFYEFYLQTFTNSKNMRIYMYDARNTYNEIISDFNAIRSKLCTNMPNLIRMIDDFEEYRIKAILTALNYNYILERLDKNIYKLKLDCKPINMRPIDNINEIQFNALFGTQSTMVEYASIRDQIKIQREKIDSEIEKFNKIVALKSETDSKLEFCEVKLNSLNDYILTIKKKLDLLRSDLNLLNSNMSLNDRRKIEILDKVTDVDKFKALQDNLDSQRKAFNDKFINSLDQVSNEQANLLNDIKNVSTIMKRNHLIFILDESGSMSGSFKSVQDSVHSILTKRKNLPTCTDKVSIIKFNDSAHIETINADIKDNISVSNMRGGGTSFVKALNKFEEVLIEINSEKFVPIVFFLSDGEGESQNLVLVKCREISKKYNNYDIIFFTVGFTSSADSSTLKKMSEVFNKGSSILKIGDEMCQLYYNANSTIDLERAFSMYEKFFEFQKDLISFKQNMLKGQIHYLKEQNDQDKVVFEKIFNDNQTFYQNQLNQAKQRANDLGDLNVVFNQKIADLNQEIIKTDEDYKFLNEDRAKLENEKQILLNKKRTNDSTYESIKADLEKQNEQLNKMIKNENDEFAKMIENQHSNIEANLNGIYDYLGALGVQIDDDFKRFYRNFQNDYFAFEKNRSFVFRKSMDIVNCFKNVYEQLKELNQNISEMTGLLESNSKLSVSTIVKIIDQIKIKHKLNNDLTNGECFKILLKRSLSISDYNAAKFTERFEYVLTQEPIESLIRKLLDKKQVDNVFDMIRNNLNQLKDDRDEIKDNLKNLDQNNNIDSTQKKEKLKNINDEITYLDRNKPDLERIIRTIDFLVNEGKELYIQKLLNNEIRNISDKLMLGFFQNMNNMDSIVNISSIQQPIKLGISY